MTARTVTIVATAATAATAGEMDGRAEALAQRHGRLEQAVLAPLARTTRGYWLFVGVLATIVAWGLFAYVVQLRNGLIVTGMRNQVLWGLYITNFVFFIGISHAGTLLSAILRVSHAGWRVPITRMAELITVVALSVGALFPIVDLGRPDRMANIFVYGRWQSPILWDVLSIFTYMTGSIFYLYLPLIPDFALCRDALAGRIRPLKRRFYELLAVGWRGTPRQQRLLAPALAMMMVIIIPVAVSVHTVVSWIFAMTLRAGWNSTVFGAYFVAGAIFSGIATIIVAMAIMRRVYHLEEFITLTQFRNLGYMLGAFTLIMAYFNLSEYVTMGYKLPEGDDVLLASLFTGRFAPYFWGYVFVGLVVPAFLVFLPRTGTVLGIVAAAVLVDVTMWIERYLIVVASLSVPLMPHAPPTYMPTWIEWSITAAAFAGFALALTLLSRLLPMVSVWEVKEHDEHTSAQIAIHPAHPERNVPASAVRVAPTVLLVLFSLLALTYFLAAPATAQAQTRDTRRFTVLKVSGPESVPLGDTARIVATLKDGTKPLAGAQIVFTSPASLAGTVGEMSIGDAITSEQGEAVLDYQLRIQGQNQIVARYYGDGNYRPAQSAAVVAATGQKQLAQRSAGLALPSVGPWIVAAVLAAVWSVYVAAMCCVARIPESEPQRPVSQGI